MEKEDVVGPLHDEMRGTTKVALVRVVVCGLKVRRSRLQAALQHRAYLMVSHLSYQDIMLKMNVLEACFKVLARPANGCTPCLHMRAYTRDRERLGVQRATNAGTSSLVE
jgi:hypothetical protein